MLQSPESAAELAALRQQHNKLDRTLDEVMAERDAHHEALDRFALAVAPEEIIGEHSSGNNPWANAFELVTPAAEVDALRARVAELEAQRAALAVRLRTGQRWQQGRSPALVSEDFVSQPELRNIFDIKLTAPWDEPGEDPCHPCGCPKRFDRHADGCPTIPEVTS
ncbi:hypothetical protein AB0G48_21055 [Streptomyces rubiginosohelvolus]|uniref:hypothetical protein n=1 Tax=Streptomyces rubiginosohelvolus TaxID=67362 RepID=UPI0033FF4433